MAVPKGVTQAGKKMISRFTFKVTAKIRNVQSVLKRGGK